MTATVASIQNAVKSYLEAAHVATPFSPAITVRIAEQSAANPPAEADPVDVVIGYEASTLLGRTATKRLEQYLIPIKCRARCVDGNQTRLASLHAVTERLRDLMATYTGTVDTTTKLRVDQLLQPHPFDMPSAITPGVFDHRFVCDFDALRTISTPTAPSDPDPLPILTKTRRAVWDAIDNWDAFTVDAASVWARKFKTPADVEELSLHEPHSSELPALAVTWGPTNPEWWTHQNQNWPQQLMVEAWFPAHQLEIAEYRLVQLVQAMQQSAPDGSTVSYVRTATGRPPSKHSPISLEPVELGRSQQTKALKGTIALTLIGQFDPTA